ncbi:MAG TPA: DNA-directed RNA polymerase subunit K [Candidatus Nanoarchaeia archaeon]|nr:DNA-directed RNA polymerase subunit K [Candidatus Nanoarchaeia archaeon]
MKHTKYEKARIIGARALQIAMGAPILVSLGEEQLQAFQFNPIRIATHEYEQDILPITIRRPMP